MPLPELDALAGAADSGRCAARASPRDLLAAPHRGRAPALDGAETLDARALAALAAWWRIWPRSASSRSGPELLELLDELAVPGGAGAAPAR